MPVYPTDFENNDLSAQVARSVNNITDHRESKIQVAEASGANSGDLWTTTRDHKMQTGDLLYFTYLSIDGGTNGYTSGTAYYVIYVSAKTFKLAISLANAIAASPTAVEITNSDITEAHYYTKDGILTGAELDGVTETIKDFADASLDTMPVSAAGTIAGVSVLAQLVKEITLFYDEIKPSRQPSACTSASGTNLITAAAHGLTTGVPVGFTVAGDTGLTINNDTLYTASVVTVNTFQLLNASTGAVISLGRDVGGTVRFYAALGATQKKYLADLKSIKFNDLQELALRLSFELKRLTAEVNKIDMNGVPAVSKYPSGEVV